MVRLRLEPERSAHSEAIGLTGSGSERCLLSSVVSVMFEDGRPTMRIPR